jgi:hypothetical protein
MNWQQALEPTSSLAKQLAKLTGCKPNRISSVPRTEERQIGQCYSNVRTVVAAKGGKAVLGWLLTWWPERFAEALHHAVWLNPEGALVDVTGPAFPLMQDTAVAFVPEGGSLEEIDPIIESQFIQIDRNPNTSKYIQAAQECMSFRASFMSHCRNSGLTFPATDGGIAVDTSRLDTEGARIFTLLQGALARKTEFGSRLWL